MFGLQLLVELRLKSFNIHIIPSQYQLEMEDKIIMYQVIKEAQTSTEPPVAVPVFEKQSTECLL